MVEIFNANLFTHLDKHLGRVGIVFGPGVLTDSHHVGRLDAPSLEFLSDDIGGHHLGQAGRGKTLVLIAANQHLAGMVIHQQIGLGGDLRWARQGNRGGCWGWKWLGIRFGLGIRGGGGRCHDGRRKNNGTGKQKCFRQFQHIILFRFRRDCLASNAGAVRGATL